MFKLVEGRIRKVIILFSRLALLLMKITIVHALNMSYIVVGSVVVREYVINSIKTFVKLGTLQNGLKSGPRWEARRRGRRVGHLRFIWGNSL